MTGILMASRRRRTGGAIQTPLTIDALTALVGVGATQATASCEFGTNGSISKAGSGSTQSWFADNQTDIGNSYWLLVATPSSGTFTTSPTLNTRHALSTARYFDVVTTGSATIRSKSVVAAYELWDAASGGTQVGSGTIQLDASVDNS